MKLANITKYFFSFQFSFFFNFLLLQPRRRHHHDAVHDDQRFAALHWRHCIAAAVPVIPSNHHIRAKL